MSNSKIAKRVSAELIEFSDSICSSEDYIKEGTALVEAVLTKLKGAYKSKELSYKIDRQFYAGSIGKKTSVNYPDFDCVVFINNVQLPLTPVVKEIEALLRKCSKELHIIPTSIDTSRITVMFQFENGTEMDLVTACNLTKSQNPDEQYQLAIDKINNIHNSDDRWLYCSSLAQRQIYFLKRQSSFTHQLIRLAKYWLKSLSLGEKVYGGSAIMEIISVAVVKEFGDSIPMLEAFKMFIQKICEMDTLKIAFIKEDSEWKLIDEEEIWEYQDHFDTDIISRNNYIIEPANPFNDKAEYISQNCFDKLKKFAKIMLDRVNMLDSNETNSLITVQEQRLVSIDISRLFEPFPLRLYREYPAEDIPTEVLIDYQSSDYNYYSSEPRYIVHIPNFDGNKNKGKKLVTQAILNNLTFLIRAPKEKRVGDKTYIKYTNGVPHLTSDEVHDAVNRFTDVNFNKSCIMIINSFDGYDYFDSDTGYDVTVCVPYIKKNKSFTICLGLKWPRPRPSRPPTSPPDDQLCNIL